MKIPSTDENPVVDGEKPKQMQYDDKNLQKYGEWSDKLYEPLKPAVDQKQKLSEALTQEQVRGVEGEEAMTHLPTR